jgi:Transposase DDE domain
MNSVEILEKLKNKIPEVFTYACMTARKYGHVVNKGAKFGKHIVALALKQLLNLTDRELADYVQTEEIGRMLGYKRHINFSLFSKVRSRSDPRIISETIDTIIHMKFKGKQIRLLVQDSTDIGAYSGEDPDAKYGYRTPSKKEQKNNQSTEKSLGFGYKLHMIAEAETEMPLVFCIKPANTHDKMLFDPLFDKVKSGFFFGTDIKFIADAALDSTDITLKLRRDGIIPLIAVNGRGFYKSRMPKDPDYGKRWAIERIFSRLKELLGLKRNRFVGIKKVSQHISYCIMAYLLRYLEW